MFLLNMHGHNFSIFIYNLMFFNNYRLLQEKIIWLQLQKISHENIQ